MAKRKRPMNVAMILRGHSILANDQGTLETLAAHMAHAAAICDQAATRD